uniref:Uncharacterized protein n=1 Tax=Neogobius melanostomus TaxID=47308 RepID=A0A8C6WPG8_9GOBI
CFGQMRQKLNFLAQMQNVMYGANLTLLIVLSAPSPVSHMVGGASCYGAAFPQRGLGRFINDVSLFEVPPDPAQNISCETTRSAHFIDCRWNSTETHVPTNYSNFSIPRERFDDDMKYQLSITTCNHFGKSHSDPLTFSLEDVVIPETPNITQIDIRNTSLTAFLRWKTISEFSENLKPFIRRRATNGEVSELSDGLVKVTGLRPLTNYEFQVKTFCSKWSPSFLKKTPGKATANSEQNIVIDGKKKERNQGLQNVNVKCLLFQPPPADDFSGKIHWYEIFFGDGQKQKDFCASLSHCSARVRLLRPISVTVVTSYGTSPLPQSPSHNQVYGFQIHSLTLQPQTGEVPGVLYNISIFAVTTRGVSAPSSSLVYSKELEPTFGPFMSVLVHESNRALVQWEELLVEQRRGFITSYTIYYKVLDSSTTPVQRILTLVSVPVGGPREQWLDCPDGTLALQMSASNAAGEGPKGNHISSHPPAPQVGLVIVIIFIITLFIAVIVNLMCWKCVRKRIKQRCIAWGPAWLGDNLPKPKNSYASKLLQLEGSEPSFFSSYIDPPLSPISLLSRDNREEPYPCVHVEPGPLQSDTTSLVPEATADCSNSSVTLGHCNYKPQTHFAEKADVKGIEEEKSSSDLFEGFDRLLSIVQGDLSGSQTGPGLVYTCTDKVDTLSLMDSDVSAEDALVDFSDNNEGTLAGGYFPQLFSTVGLM